MSSTLKNFVFPIAFFKKKFNAMKQTYKLIVATHHHDHIKRVCCHHEIASFTTFPNRGSNPLIANI